MNTMNCPTCGRFMRRLKLVARCRIAATMEVAEGRELEPHEERTHICPLEEYTYATNSWHHFKNEAERDETERLEIERITKEWKRNK